MSITAVFIGGSRHMHTMQVQRAESRIEFAVHNVLKTIETKPAPWDRLPQMLAEVEVRREVYVPMHPPVGPQSIGAGRWHDLDLAGVPNGEFIVYYFIGSRP